MVLVDTSVWVDFFNGKFNGQTEKLDHYLSSTVIGMTKTACGTE